MRLNVPIFTIGHRGEKPNAIEIALHNSIALLNLAYALM